MGYAKFLSNTIGRELSKLAVELSGKIQGTDYKIIYKLHPGEYQDWKNRYPVNKGVVRKTAPFVTKLDTVYHIPALKALPLLAVSELTSILLLITVIAILIQLSLWLMQAHLLSRKNTRHGVQITGQRTCVCQKTR